MSQDDVDGINVSLALFTLKAGVPIVSVGIKAKYRIFSKIEVQIGKPIKLE